MLHTVNKSPFTHSKLKDCTAVAQASDAVLLLEDGVYGAVPDSEAEHLLKHLHERQVSLFAIKDDVDARGLGSNLSPLVKAVSYQEFVELTVQHASIQSWY